MSDGIKKQIIFLVLKIAVGIAVGGLLGLLAVYRLSPAFTPDDKLIVRWTQEKSGEQKDNYVVFIFERKEKKGAIDTNLLPVVMTAYIRQGKFDRFDQLLEEHSKVFEDKAAHLHTYLNWMDELIGRFEIERARALLDRFENERQFEAFARIYTKYDTRIRMRNWDLQLSKLTNLLDEKLGSKELTTDDPMFDEIHNILLSFKDIDFKVRADYFRIAKDGYDNYILFLERVFLDVPGLLDKTRLDFYDYFNLYHKDDGIEGFTGTLSGIIEFPKQYDEWKRFAEGIDDDACINLICVRNYIRGVLKGAQEKDPEAAIRILQKELIDNEGCQGSIKEIAQELIAKFQNANS